MSQQKRNYKPKQTAKNMKAKDKKTTLQLESLKVKSFTIRGGGWVTGTYSDVYFDVLQPGTTVPHTYQNTQCMTQIKTMVCYS